VRAGYEPAGLVRSLVPMAFELLDVRRVVEVLVRQVGGLVLQLYLVAKALVLETGRISLEFARLFLGNKMQCPAHMSCPSATL